eukprot:scaffold10267_cov116-Isochrysis_galbana.AAC.12
MPYCERGRQLGRHTREPLAFANLAEFSAPLWGECEHRADQLTSQLRDGIRDEIFASHHTALELGCGSCLEGQCAGEHGCQSDAQTPHINLWALIR